MSDVAATIEKIEYVDSLHLVTFRCGQVQLKMVSLELNAQMQVGSRVKLGCKPTAVAVARTDRVDDLETVLSYTNRIPVMIEQLEKGKLLATLNLSFGTAFLEAIVTAESVDRLALRKGVDVVALIKVTELFIAEVLDD